MSAGPVLLIYNLLLPVALIFALPRYLSKIRSRGGYEGHFAQRRARYTAAIADRLAKMEHPIWIHAVSVGEVLVALKLVAELRRQSPGVDVVLSTTTSTGYKLASERAEEGMLVIYNPLDFRWTAKRALRAIDPARLVLIEAEVWPNLVSLARKRGIPVTLVNARLSERSERRFKRFGALVRPVFAMLDHVFVQTAEDAERMVGIGAREDAVRVMGSIKFDPEGVERPPQADDFEREMARLFGNRRPMVVLAGSTHDGEEAFIGTACREACDAEADFEIFYVAVPRHFERADHAQTQLREAGFRPLLRSAMESSPDGCCAPDGDYDALIVDTTGELRAWYFIADAVVIGKSFLSMGGQNPVEAILADKPVLYGPHMNNFAVLTRALDDLGGARRAEDGKELAAALSEVLADEALAERLVRSARDVLAVHQGATARTASFLLGDAG